MRPVRPAGRGILVLKRLEDALACKDTIHGIIKGWGVSNDIEGTLVAPASEGQVRAMAAAYDMAGLTPAHLQYMACPGSGTPVGDKVELASIRAVLDHEYRTGSRSGARHRTRLGVESESNENLSVYSRYSLEGAVSGERGQATMGLKNQFRLSEGLTGTVAAENLSTVSGAEMGDFTSIATGWNYTPPESDYMVKGNYEVKLEKERNKHLFSAGGIKRMNRCWSGMFKGDIWFTNEYAAANRAKVSSTLGVSCRSHIFEGLTLLSLIKSRYEKNSPSHPGGIDKEMTVSAEANYRFNRYWQTEGKTPARWVKNTFKKYSASSTTFMYQARVIRVLSSGWDISLTGRLIHQRETGTLRSEGGLEVGKVIMRNIWIGAGYDFADHNDHRAGINDFSQIGFHVGMRMKFNEKLLNYFYQ